MEEVKKFKRKGFQEKSQERKQKTKKSKERLISWSPWPPANFKTRYPAFPLVTTVLMLILLRWISIAKELA